MPVLWGMAVAGAQNGSATESPGSSGAVMARLGAAGHLFLQRISLRGSYQQLTPSTGDATQPGSWTRIRLPAHVQALAALVRPGP